MELRLRQKGEFVLSFGLGDFGVADLPLKSCANKSAFAIHFTYTYHELSNKDRPIPYLDLREYSYGFDLSPITEYVSSRVTSFNFSSWLHTEIL